MKKLFTLFAAALMAGSLMAGSLIKFEEPQAATAVAGSTYGSVSKDLVELPAGATVDAWYLNGVKVTSSSNTPIQNQNVNVSFVGNDVYVQGIFTDLPNAWVKGTNNAGVVTFKKLQYLGKYGSYDIWMVGNNGTAGVITDAEATYDAAANTISFSTPVIANAADDRIYYLTWLENVVLSPIVPTGISNSAVKSVSRKELRNGQVVIIRDGKTFNAVGAKL